ncbi:MAG: dethiobiotin synthase [Verrucomicrobia bacterium]|nr:dethiobiotin synthase [Verrucomicrobiota bacterium]
MRHSAPILVVTGTDTGVGKTVFSALLATWLRRQGTEVGVFKPVSSGGREDAGQLRRAAGAELSLDEVNPWFFAAPLAPVLAARLEKRRVLLKDVLARGRALAQRVEVLIVEGAGGLLSPLGEGFDTRDLVVGLRACPIVVASNRLGAVNQVRLVIEALPAKARTQAQVVLVRPPRPDRAAVSNAALLAEHFPAARIHDLPRLSRPHAPAAALNHPAVVRTVGAVAVGCGLGPPPPCSG